MIGTETVHIVGCGGLGSNLAWLVARLGRTALTLYDGDTFAPHNLGNQACGRDDIGRNKAEALAGHIGAAIGSQVRAVPSFVGERVPFAGIVFVCVDSMAARKTVMASVFGNASVAYAFEARMDASRCVVYSFDPNDALQADLWRHYWHPDDEAQNEALACGGPLPVSYTPLLAACIMAESFARWRDWRSGAGDPPPHLRWADLRKNAMHAEWWK